jgi:selenocysteine-specific elongation factor
LHWPKRPAIEKSEVERGMWIVAPQLHLPRYAASMRGFASSPRKPALKHWTPVHLSTSAPRMSPARIALLGADEIAPGTENWAQITVDRDICALAGDRFILRDASARHTIGGGRVLDIFPPSRKQAQRGTPRHARRAGRRQPRYGLAAGQ